MGIVKASVAVAMGLFGSVSLLASPVLPSVVNVSYVPAAPAAGARMGAGSRVGFAQSKKSSNVVSGAAIGVGILAIAAGTAGIVAGTSGNGGRSTSP